MVSVIYFFYDCSMTQAKCECNIALNRTIALLRQTLREKSPYSEFFWSAFSRFRIEYGEVRSISPYSVQMRENADQKNYEQGHFSNNDRNSYNNKSFTKTFVIKRLFKTLSNIYGGAFFTKIRLLQNWFIAKSH